MIAMVEEIKRKKLQ